MRTGKAERAMIEETQNQTPPQKNQMLPFRNKQFICKTGETLNTVYTDVFYTNPYSNTLDTKLTNNIRL